MGRKLGVILLALMLCLGAFAPVAAIAGASTTYVTLPSNMSALNVRSTASTGSDVVTWVCDGDEIELNKVGSEWTKITVLRNGKSGYIKNKYVLELPKNPSAPETPSKSGAAQAGTVTGKGVNVRKGPGSGYAKVTSLASGSKLRIWSQSGNWYFVTTASGKDGWISKTYVKLTYAAVTTARVNFRQSINGKLIRTLPVGTNVTVQSISGTWSKVKVGTTTGWLFSKYLK